ncbi:ABC transporter substrate-binding protein [Orrella marina]|uniref:ABC transporter substrate-binding protein n=1 Tax=Orrella marina TaxID=2163011 RepID=A0A2R4XKD9_9BURK|nr:ABC transporter substrate-binding protein [Orrella marina]AWB34260.1 ABC transporter substrate-binding protein [Orrella marina]
MKKLLGALSVAATGLCLTTPASAQTEVTFYFPVAVGGPITKTIDGYAADFNKENPDIKVTPVYAGTYQETIVKALTAHKSGTPPTAAILLSTDTFTLIDEDAVVPIDNFATSDADRKWLDGFFPAFMANGQIGGKTWGVPFQRSTVVMYWNKEAFKQAGLDPEKAPANWDEMVSMGKKLTRRDANGNVTQWGIQVPSSGFPYWLFQCFTTPNDVLLANSEGNQVTFDDVKVIESLQYWMDLSQKYKIHPPGVVQWGTTPRDFMEGKAAMIWTTTGNLTNIRNNAPFDFGVAMIPANLRNGSPTGGGNFYIFKQASEAEQKAAFEFSKWLTQPERAAQWSIDTGYVAVSPAAYETEALKTYAAEFPPALVARDQLEYSVAEFSTHDNQRVTKALNDGLQAALTGSKTAQQAMQDAQAEANRILRTYR